MLIPSLDNARFNRGFITAFRKSGWDLADISSAHKLGGPTVYICDVESGGLVVFSAFDRILEQAKSDFQKEGVTFEDICNGFGTLIADFFKQEKQLSEEERQTLGLAALLYISETKSYRYFMDNDITPVQLLILRYKDASNGESLLRPNPIVESGPISPVQVEQIATVVLNEDRKNHPHRFSRTSVLPFKLNKVFQ
jgi:hypothetical protein